MASRKKIVRRSRPEKAHPNTPLGYTEDDISTALANNAGIAALAASALGTTRQNVAHWVRNSKRLQKVCDDANEKTLDIAEGHIVKAVTSGKDMQTTRWYTERKGKHRGWATRVETTGKNGGPVLTADLSKLTDQEVANLERILAKLEGAEDVED